LSVQHLDRDAGGDPALRLDGQVAVLGDLADDGDMEVPLLEDGQDLGLAAALDDDQHPLLRLGEHHLVRRHPELAAGHPVEVDQRARAAPRGGLRDRTGQPGGAEVLDPDHCRLADQLLERLDEALLEEGVADLDRRAAFLRAVVQLEGGEGGAVDPVPTGVGADQQ